MPAVHLVDASFFVFRAYYSIPDQMADGEGRPVNALYGFARFLSDLMERERPEYLAVAFDESLAGSFRSRIYPAYKANREPPPPGLKEQFGRCRELCALLGARDFGSAEYEADDIIGTLATRLRAQGFRSTLVTRDKDLAQLVRAGDEFWDYTAEERFGYEDIAARFGVHPERIADFLALTGDAVDNIPGVPGIGRKTAAALLATFASLDELYANLDRVATLGLRGAAGVAARLAAHRPAAYLARELTRIACDMPLAATPATLRRAPPDLEGLGAFYDRAGFGPALRRQAERIAAHARAA
ncbi:MAG TPA: 5'-3' exonuclease H3TH domain-containing protein [Steroidobacteraceae bacterium]|nr:5'-3' exonuclease H3TH domain-containing protein [Steroidobacteraceae bacterium]